MVAVERAELTQRLSELASRRVGLRWRERAPPPGSTREVAADRPRLRRTDPA
jgi:hypothetical protein